jgi:mannose-6-phosphate isomerase
MVFMTGSRLNSAGVPTIFPVAIILSPGTIERSQSMQEALYPLRFRPIFKTALWGGAALPPMLGAESSAEPIGEAWVLSDHGEPASEITNGPLAGRSLRDLMVTHQRELLGDINPANGRFPLLLKFLDARLPLSVQVHPDDDLARQLDTHGPGLGKTEAWVILKNDGGKIFAGLRERVGPDEFRSALAAGTLAEVLHSYSPQVGDCFYLEAGTVHAIGGGLLLFEVQQTSDITYRLHDWGRLDARTGKPRALHIEAGLQCINYERGPCTPVRSEPDETGCECLVDCRYFTVDRQTIADRRSFRNPARCRILVSIDGSGKFIHAGIEYPLRLGDVYLLPATLGQYEVIPDGIVTLLMCSPK